LAYAIAPWGRWIYLSVRNARFGADLYALDRLSPGKEPVLLLACLADLCTAPQPAPDGRTLAFQRSDASGQHLRIWLCDVTTGEAKPVSPESHYAQDPHWSKDGKLAYYDATRQGYVVLNASQEEEAFFPSDTHAGYTWTADGQALLVVRLQPLPQVKGTHGEPLVTAHLWRFSLTAGVPLDLSRPPKWKMPRPPPTPRGGGSPLPGGTWTPIVGPWAVRRG
jgi:Periplasmic component of the Tol biopolymer transport system